MGFIKITPLNHPNSKATFFVQHSGLRILCNSRYSEFSCQRLEILLIMATRPGWVLGILQWHQQTVWPRKLLYWRRLSSIILCLM